MIQDNYIPVANDADRRLWTITMDTPPISHRQLHASRRYSYEEPPWLVMPSNAVPFQRISSINLPAANGSDVEVVSFVVDQGYDGVITSLLHQYTGSGFLDGSGNLHWRLRVGDVWAEGMGDMTTRLGTLQSPYQIYRSGVRIFSGNIVRYIVNHSTGSTLSGGIIICGLFGWLYPTA